MKIRPVGADLFHPVGRSDMTKLIVAFRSSENAPENAIVDLSVLLYGHFIWVPSISPRWYLHLVVVEGLVGSSNPES